MAETKIEVFRMQGVGVNEKPILMNSEMVRATLAGRKTQTRRVIKPQPDAFYHGPDIPRDANGISIGKPYDEANSRVIKCPYGEIGDELWVRETFADVNCEGGPALMYKADGDLRTWEDFSTTFGPDYGAGKSMDYEAYPADYTMWWSDLLNGEPDHKWKPSIHMPRWASRIQLRITDVKVEQVQNISEADAIAEGAMRVELPPCDDAFNPPGSYGYAYHDDGENTIYPKAKEAFKNLWDSINGKPRADGVDISWAANPWVWSVEFELINQEITN